MSVRTVPAAGAPVASQRLDRVLRAGMGRKEAPTALVQTDQTPGFLLITWPETMPNATPAHVFNSNSRGGALSVPTSPAMSQTVSFTDADLRLLGLEAFANFQPAENWTAARSPTVAPGYTFYVHREQHTDWVPDAMGTPGTRATCRPITTTRYRMYAVPLSASPPPSPPAPPARAPSFMDTGPGP